MTDPDYDTSAGVTGAAVVEESLRQKCIWNIYGGAEAPEADRVRWLMHNFRDVVGWRLRCRSVSNLESW